MSLDKSVTHVPGPYPGDLYFCDQVYYWINHWPEEIYKHVDPVTALVELARSGLKDKIRDDLRSLLGGSMDATVRARFNDALRRIRELP